MFRKMLRAKLHRVRVTDADVDYEGSLTLPPALMTAADIAEYEAIHVWNVTRGTRFETYAMMGEENSTDVCVNGAAAHLAGPGDLVIVAAFADISESSVGTHRPRLVFVDERNEPKEIVTEIAGPKRRVSTL